MSTSKRNTNTSNGSATIESTNSPPLPHSASAVPQTSKELEKAERESIVLWKQPLLTLEYFNKEVFELSCIYGHKYVYYHLPNYPYIKNE